MWNAESPANKVKGKEEEERWKGLTNLVIRAGG